ncbi:MAG: (2Fe-2S)-binding protein [Deltaproteobacteria bacterium]|nr:(2Fe-2S)-binding protein [Deltaproteobacteria bacterium]
MMALVYFERQSKTVSANAGNNLRLLAKKNGVQIYHGIDKLLNCRGNGLCGTCMVEVFPAKPEFVSPPTAMEEKKLKNYNNPNLRLACQVKVHGPMRVKTYPVELYASSTTSAPPVTL